MTADMLAPAGHTAAGGVLIGTGGARRRLIVFEDPQCPFCRQFELVCGDLLRREIAAGAISVEYRMRCFFGPESVRAANALALGAETGRFDQLLARVFAAQPPEATGGYTPDDLINLGLQAGIGGTDFEAGIREGRYQDWVVHMDKVFEHEAPDGTPAVFLDGRPLERDQLFDPEVLGNQLRT